MAYKNFTFCYIFLSTSAPGYIGCYREPTPQDKLVLDPPAWTHPSMTIHRCIEYCVQLRQDAQFAGLSVGNECYCGNAENQRDFEDHVRHDNECDVPCKGNRFEVCGGENRISIYDGEFIDRQLNKRNGQESFLSLN